jgi:hypothetical protein
VVDTETSRVVDLGLHTCRLFVLRHQLFGARELLGQFLRSCAVTKRISLVGFGSAVEEQDSVQDTSESETWTHALLIADLDGRDRQFAR